MKWEEVRELFPNKFVKMKILNSRIEDNIKYIDDVAIIKVIDDDLEATRELVHAKGGELVFHTEKKELMHVIKNRFGFRV